MSDHWADIRRLVALVGNQESPGPMERLLTDADALLEDNKLLREALYEVAHGKHSGRGYANKVLSESALPEHLR